MSSAARKTFSYIFIGEADKNIDSAKDVRTKPEKADAPHLHLLAAHSCRRRHRTFLSQVVTSAFEMVSAKVQAILCLIMLSVDSKPHEKINVISRNTHSKSI